jgi:hypothetical protein
MGFQVLGRYPRRQLEMDRILAQLLLAGMSTREVGDKHVRLNTVGGRSQL